MVQPVETLIPQLQGADSGSRVLPTLLPALARLDRRLERAAAVAGEVYGPDSASDPFRGLYVNMDEVERLLSQPPGAPILGGVAATPDDPAEDSATFAWLRDTYDLTPFDLDLLLIALAPEVDLRYERLYTFLQNDVSRRRPSLDLALNLLCASTEAKLARRAHVAAEAPLRRHGLLHLIPDPNQPHSPLLSHTLKLDPQVVEWLLGQDGLDPRLIGLCQRINPRVILADMPLPAGVREGLTGLVAAATPLRLYFQGTPDSGLQRITEAVAEAAGTRLLAVDTLTLGAAPNPDELLTLLVRTARFEDALLYFDRVDAGRDDERAQLQGKVWAALAGHPGVVILSGEQPWAGHVDDGGDEAGVITVPFPLLDTARRRQYWRAALDEAAIPLSDPELDTLAARFRLSPGQITASVHAAQSQARWQTATEAPRLDQSVGPTGTDLFAAARAHSGQDLLALARKITPGYTWADLVLPADALAQLHEICERVAYSEQVLDTWGFGRKLAHGKGTAALFVGPSGTGKTMAAEIIAHALGLDLYKIDLSGVISKYIGETEKNLDRIFTAAEHANAILFFDEADALFGKRSEVHDSHDRYANIEISYLLQKMEQYEGIAILATNLRGNLDEAFVRRMAFTIHFPFPDEAHRRRIWAGIWPLELPRTADVDLDFLAAQFKLSGGNIKNIALAAAFLAAADRRPVTMAHLRQALRREYQKLGKVLTDAELLPERMEVGA